MAVLESCPKHNMVAYMEKTVGNTEYITAKVAVNHVSISEASIRSDLLFDDAGGIDSLPNQAIFDVIQLMGKTHLLEDKLIPSVGVFDEVFSIWKVIGVNTRDLGSFGEETDKTTNLHQHLSRISTQKLETASQITRDVVTTLLKTASQDLKTASDFKSLEKPLFFNQSKYIKEMLKKFGLEDSKPMKTPMSSDTKLTKDEECESVDSTKYRGMIAVKRIFRYIKGTTHLGLWYPKGTDIETIVYADSDHAGDYVDRKSTSGICTFVGCCLTSWFSKKQTTLAISTTEAEYVSARKACQQALWMKQALIDYDVRLDDIPIMCDYKGVIDLSKNPMQHSRTKHNEIRHHFLRDNVQKGHISIKKVPSIDNIASILTKPL
ncbi:hypothetical protein Tco_1107127 [Tanacetum coccineum]